MVVPILNDKSNNDVLGIIWAAIPKGDLNQYTQKDIDYISRFSSFVKKFLLDNGNISENTSLKTDLLDCKKAYEDLSIKIKRDQEYFSSIIHDVRTPMNGVIGFLELLKMNEKNSQKKEYIETALKSAEDMVALINDALDISKLTSGKMSIENILKRLPDQPFRPI